jgi:hypothetical protein
MTISHDPPAFVTRPAAIKILGWDAIKPLRLYPVTSVVDASGRQIPLFLKKEIESRTESAAKIRAIRGTRKPSCP